MTSMSDQERERVWELHTSSEFDTLDLDTTMANWDQTTVLAQTGLLSAETMARLPVMADQRGTLADGPLNQLTGRG